MINRESNFGGKVIEYVIPHKPSNVLDANGNQFQEYTSLKFDAESDPNEIHKAVREFIQMNYDCGDINQTLKELGFNECIG